MHRLAVVVENSALASVSFAACSWCATKWKTCQTKHCSSEHTENWHAASHYWTVIANRAAEWLRECWD